MQYLKINKIIILSAIMGSIAGYLYYYYVGCASGTCSITSRPLNSTLYGGVMGALLGSMFQSKKKTPQKDHSK